jgi:hypothetical protein
MAIAKSLDVRDCRQPVTKYLVTDGGSALRPRHSTTQDGQADVLRLQTTPFEVTGRG